jgi:hypothetical protein
MTTRERIRLLAAQRKMTRLSKFPKSGICGNCHADLIRRAGRAAAVKVISVCPKCGAKF